MPILFLHITDATRLRPIEECAIQSAARLNPRFQVLLVSNSLQSSEHAGGNNDGFPLYPRDPATASLPFPPRCVRLQYEAALAGTPLERWYAAHGHNASNPRLNVILADVRGWRCSIRLAAPTSIWTSSRPRRCPALSRTASGCSSIGRRPARPLHGVAAQQRGAALPLPEERHTAGADGRLCASTSRASGGRAAPCCTRGSGAAAADAQQRRERGRPDGGDGQPDCRCRRPSTRSTGGSGATLTRRRRAARAASRRRSSRA